ncbi:DUF402 domain-containing protein [Paenibacillus endoradicis]|uniref:DUF402 domain-containing protein n=1 Tax=Paenibacillus endoradicis TaxID=2972487 RepID=UPI002158E35B|nr:DUF402 domain-containing protein [Paenibacillus endoradicis]MCR8657429.1 DUF402 domain-containing protein [Paenibacillus endoradicis]
MEPYSQLRKPVQIQAYKYPDRLHYEWQADLIELNEQYAMVACHAGRLFQHHTKQKQFIMPYPSIEIFFFEEWYTFSVSFQENGEMMHYCNIAMPAQIENNIISFIDLDLDYLQEPHEDWKVVDEEEFIHNQQMFKYPEDLIEGARLGLAKLQQIVVTKQFPFDEKIDIQKYESVL